MYYVKKGLQILLSFFMVTAGVLHFVNEEFFTKIMPPYLPLHRELVYLSGVFEILLGIMLLIPRFQNLAAWGLIALLIAVFPANVHMFMDQEKAFGESLFHTIRLPLQGVLILWAYWYTIKAKPNVSIE
jgi:uncharacterized membrane protein